MTGLGAAEVSLELFMAHRWRLLEPQCSA
jgi:hypothetical protein